MILGKNIKLTGAILLHNKYFYFLTSLFYCLYFCISTSSTILNAGLVMEYIVVLLL